MDLYFLEREAYEDLSDKFYDISWDSTTTMKSEQKQTDFISGYSMTNKYEDFAESFAYFVLHNADFIKKASKSDILMKKYIFFFKYVFNNKEFFETNFDSQKTPSYFWDTTKIDINLQNFLQYIENR
ncbi:hypothetical protein LDC_1997 [sediment metagenome]|uniref:Uncharacterized protein n=1 Tax=sediment metagenome TaxID=749907 RepID=D9PKD2_9ZZZZ